MSSTNQAPAKPINPSQILEFLVDSALNGRDPDTQLLGLYDDKKFAYRSGRSLVTHAAWCAEMKAFDELRHTGDFPAELRACLTATNKLVDRALNRDQAAKVTEDGSPIASHSLQASSPLRVDAEVAWAGLMIQELNYLATCNEWSDDHVSLLQHSSSLLSTLLYHWSESEDRGIPPHLSGDLIRSLHGVLTHAPFRDLFTQYQAPGVGEAVTELITLSLSLSDVVLLEEVIDVIPNILSICQKLDPETFVRVQEDDLQGEEFSDVFEEPTWTDGDSSHDKGSIVSEDEAFEEELTEANQAEYLTQIWGRLFKMCLLSAQLTGFLDHREELFLEIVRESSFGMDGYQLALDALVCVSAAGTRTFIPELVEHCKTDQLATQFLLSLVSFQKRTGVNDAGEHLQDVVRALQAVERRDRSEILRAARDLIHEAPEIFDGTDNPRLAKKALAVLHKELKKPR